MAAENVDLVDEFIYLGSLISHDGGSEAEILRRIGISRECCASLRRTSGGLIYSQTLRCSSTGPASFQSCSMGARHGLSARPWQSTSMPSTPGVCGKFYGFRTPGSRHTTNDTVRSITGCLPVSEKVKSFRLRFFGHLARSAPEEDHHRVIATALRPPSDWRRPVGHPRPSWLRAIDEDV